MEPFEKSCSCCKRLHSIDMFVGCNGNSVKVCKACRTRLAQWQSDNRHHKIDAQKRWYLENKERVAGLRREYRLNNKEDIVESKKRYYLENKESISVAGKQRYANNIKDVAFIMKQYKRHASNRGYEWDEDMTFDLCSQMMTSPCHYCAMPMPMDRLHGIDRMDNCKGYSESNCVGCCTYCNYSKGSLDAKTFVKRCIHIASIYCNEISLYPEAWPLTMPGSFAVYKKNAKKKERVFQLTKDDYIRVINIPCQYCRRAISETNKSGIDRIDNARGYELSNIAPCCGECNLMKKEMSQTEFIDRCARISERSNQFKFPDMQTCLKVITKNTHKYLHQ